MNGIAENVVMQFNKKNFWLHVRKNSSIKQKERRSDQNSLLLSELAPNLEVW